MSLPPPSHNFSLFGGLEAPQPPCFPGELRLPDPSSLISLNVSLVPWKCIQFSDLNTLNVYTIFGSENLGSVHYFRI